MDVPIIFITGAFRDDAHRIRGYDAGAVDFIEKPIDDAVLLSKVRILLDLFGSRRRRRKRQCRAGTASPLSATLRGRIAAQQFERRHRRLDPSPRSRSDAVARNPRPQPFAGVGRRRFPFEPRGCVFLADRDDGDLVMAVWRGLGKPLLDACSRVPVGRCLCGRAAAGGEIVHAATADERHGTVFPGMEPHGHYCVPIRRGDEMLGVLNLYLPAGHARDAAEVEFVTAVADALAGIIVRKRSEKETRLGRSRLQAIMDTASALIASLDEHQRYRFANVHYQRVFGISPEDMVGRTVREVIGEAT